MTPEQAATVVTELSYITTLLSVICGLMAGNLLGVIFFPRKR